MCLDWKTVGVEEGFDWESIGWVGGVGWSVGRMVGWRDGRQVGWSVARVFRLLPVFAGVMCWDQW